MKKIIMALVTILFMLCAALPCFAEAVWTEDVPRLRMEQQKQEYRTPQGQVCIVTDYKRLTLLNAEAFPALAKRLEEIHNQEWKLNLEFDARESYDRAVELKKYRPEDYMYFLLEERVWLNHVDRNIMSLYVEFYQNRGGAHPNIDIRSYNFDPATGNFITLDDVLAPGKRNEFREKFVKPALEKWKKERQLFYYDNYKTIVDDLFQRDYAGEPPLTWTWGEEGITMHFPPDTLAPSVVGAVQAFVPFKGNEKLFNKKYLK